MPDFRVIHRSTGVDVFMEVVGFWKRSSLERLVRLLPRHGPRRFVLAISDRLKVDEDAAGELKGPILRFREIPSASELLTLLETFVSGGGRESSPQLPSVSTTSVDKTDRKSL